MKSIEHKGFATTGAAVFARSYSQLNSRGLKENWRQAVTRVLLGLTSDIYRKASIFGLGQFTQEEQIVIRTMLEDMKAFCSGRFLWVGGRPWLAEKSNHFGAFNCTSQPVDHPEVFGYLMNLAMQGSGTGAVLTKANISQLPVIVNQIEVSVAHLPSSEGPGEEGTVVDIQDGVVVITVGDSRQGWVDAYQEIINIAMGTAGHPPLHKNSHRPVKIEVDLSNVRKAGQKLKGFGGVSNPIKLPPLFPAMAKILNGAWGRQLNSLECCLLIDHAAACVVAGNIRRCLPGGALVHTRDNGLVPIQQIRVGDMVQTKTGFKKVLKTYDQGIQPVYETATNGLSLRSTLSHRYAVINPHTFDIDWVRADHLSQGDKLAVVSHGIAGTETYICGDTKTDEGTAYLTGYVHSAYCNSKQDRPRPTDWMNNWREFTEPRASLVKSKVQAICSSLVKEIVIDSPEMDRQDNKVPDFILRGPQGIRAAFLAGVRDATPPPIGEDGDNTSYLTLTRGDANSGKSQWFRELGVICFSLGIDVRVEDESISEGFSHLGVKILDADAMNRVVLPYSALKDMPFVEANHHFYQFQVTDTCTYIDMMATYDIEVEDDHCFFCDGFLTHNSAGMRQFSWDDPDSFEAKKGLWTQDDNGNWISDPEKDVLRMANHTRVSFHPPSKKDILESVTSQYWTGEGAIQYAPEAIARANADILQTPQQKFLFLASFPKHERGDLESATDFLKYTYEQLKGEEISPEELNHRMNRFGLNPCGEIVGTNFTCNLSEVHLNRVNPFNIDEQTSAFRASALMACALIVDEFDFDIPRFQDSKELDPIIGVSFTGLFDHFAEYFGPDWIQWFIDGRSSEHNSSDHWRYTEAARLKLWREVVEATVEEYCTRRGIKKPNRVTTVQPAGSKSLLTGASCGWHPPKASFYIRRITFAKDDPIALACHKAGYSLVPAQGDTDEDGKLLDDPFDPRCTEWLLEFPVMSGAGKVAPETHFDFTAIPALAQLDFYMQVQNNYVTHNASATIELTEQEIPEVADKIYELITKQQGYISVTLLAKSFDLETYPRLPFEPISREQYLKFADKVKAAEGQDLIAILNEELKSREDVDKAAINQGPAQCDSDACLLP